MGKQSLHPDKVKFHCESCNTQRNVEIGTLTRDNQNGQLIWGDIVCVTCRFVIATISADEPGVYRFVKLASVKNPWEENNVR